ncbi:MAG: type I-E CRISPR-associated endoribonuclease Cas2e [Actinomyces sp.]|nr:type I-E CRISPR-associated endoribonuclease Cas2e [Actinomyces sp.]MCI1642610.1 type I-E CRISPR-associated endoribonuclease Cas2e [Actinomyces sp.]MCI1663162.1 type I-E CRISPR-associated endoribonuclease Cas2e [Actinomyces sp.]MCI1691727.1 type I-E CRISPR-associated endoribonuclease Cas2e [Actinomyces sp.]
MVLVLSAVPEGLRGHVTRWLMEVSTGVYVGNASPRVRDRLWDIVQDTLGSGRATLVYSARNEQGLEFRVLGDPWEPTDFEGLTLMMRPSASVHDGAGSRPGMSRFQRYRRARGQRPRSGD